MGERGNCAVRLLTYVSRYRAMSSCSSKVVPDRGGPMMTIAERDRNSTTSMSSFSSVAAISVASVLTAGCILFAKRQKAKRQRFPVVVQLEPAAADVPAQLLQRPAAVIEFPEMIRRHEFGLRTRESPTMKRAI